MPPSYDSREYWNDRFAREDSFDWLLPNSISQDILWQQTSCLHSRKASEILHIGCGNSKLSLDLAGLLPGDGEVLNVHFSETVVSKAQRQRAERTKWMAADLLDTDDVGGKLGRVAGQCDLIVDKGTSDSIACGDDVAVSLPYPFQEYSSMHASSSPPSTRSRQAKIHRLHILAVHLAALTPSSGRWIVFSS